ncbi:hypothetical protein I6J32_01060 [Moraxella osloensis]|nr:MULTISPECIES: hypothetical protein [Moraxella]QRO13505.1 hypothetical protein I6J32_01060 [Moraxella osloensis]
MIITHLERATQLYQALQDYQQSTHAFSQPSHLLTAIWSLRHRPKS